MLKHIDMVKQFQDVFGDPNFNSPTLNISDRNKDLRITLLQEELDELKEATENNDLVEIADALADIQYLLFGTVLMYGMRDKFEQIFEEVHRSNMTKVGKNGEILKREDGKVIKPDTFEQPKIKEILEENMPKGVWKDGGGYFVGIDFAKEFDKKENEPKYFMGIDHAVEPHKEEERYVNNLNVKEYNHQEEFYKTIKAVSPLLKEIENIIADKFVSTSYAINRPVDYINDGIFGFSVPGPHKKEEIKIVTTDGTYTIIKET